MGSRCLDLSMLRRYHGYNIVKPYPFGPASTNAECAWKSFLLAESGALEEDKSTETGESASWFCSVCPGDPSGQGFENFTTHLYSQEHAQERLRWLPSKRAEDEDKEVAEDVAENEEAVEAGVEPQPVTWEWFRSHMYTTPSERPLDYATTVVMNQPKNETNERSKNLGKSGNELDEEEEKCGGPQHWIELLCPFSCFWSHTK